MTALPAWVSEWSCDRGPAPQEGIDWVRSRPESVRVVLRRCPPSCVVRVRTERFHPRIKAAFEEWDRLAVVRSVWEGGQLGLTSPDQTEVRWRVEEADVEEVVAFHMGMTREWVASVLA